MYDYNICNRCYSEMRKKYIPKIDAAIWVCPNCYNVEPCGYDSIVSEVHLEQEIDTGTKRYYYQKKILRTFASISRNGGYGDITTRRRI